MENAVMVLPIGSFTPRMSQRVCDTAIANSHQSPVVISLQNAEAYSWSALHLLASFLRSADTRHAIRIAYAKPRTRSLLEGAGIANLWHVRDATAVSQRRIFVS